MVKAENPGMADSKFLSPLKIDKRASVTFNSFFSRVAPQDYTLTIDSIQYCKIGEYKNKKDRIRKVLDKLPEEMDNLRLIRKKNEILQFLKLVSKYILGKNKPNFSSNWEITEPIFKPNHEEQSTLCFIQISNGKVIIKVGFRYHSILQ